MLVYNNVLKCNLAEYVRLKFNSISRDYSIYTKNLLLKAKKELGNTLRFKRRTTSQDVH